MAFNERQMSATGSQVDEEMVWLGDSPMSTIDSSDITWPSDTPMLSTDSNGITRDSDVVMSAVGTQVDNETERLLSTMGVDVTGIPQPSCTCQLSGDFWDEGSNLYGSTSREAVHDPDSRTRPSDSEKTSRKRSPVNNITKRQKEGTYVAPVEVNVVNNDPRVLDILMKDSMMQPMPEVTPTLRRNEQRDIRQHHKWCCKMLNNPFN
nr:uncharacterized protein LOC123770634 [Procambarus clarkii]XP_045618632.1 uncharacterized protein LOC123770634 [Procambarus clarkii]